MWISAVIRGVLHFSQFYPNILIKRQKEICLFVYLIICLSVCLFVCLMSVWLSVCLAFLPEFPFKEHNTQHLRLLWSLPFLITPLFEIKHSGDSLQNFSRNVCAFRNIYRISKWKGINYFQLRETRINKILHSVRALYESEVVLHLGK